GELLGHDRDGLGKHRRGRRVVQVDQAARRLGRGGGAGASRVRGGGAGASRVRGGGAGASRVGGGGGAARPGGGGGARADTRGGGGGGGVRGGGAGANSVRELLGRAGAPGLACPLHVLHDELSLTGVLAERPGQRRRPRSRRRRLAPRPGAQEPWRRAISSVSCGTTLNRSPTTPKSASSRIGASGSLLITMMVFEVCMPARCWIAPEMPTAR